MPSNTSMRAAWQLVFAARSGIIGVYSESTAFCASTLAAMRVNAASTSAGGQFVPKSYRGKSVARLIGELIWAAG